jgi:nucleotide-binding universal stress UspA family protein
VFRVGDPGHELVRFAESHPDSLIIMSTCGRGNIGRLLMGSVISAAVRASSNPILVVPASHELGVNPPALVGRRHPAAQA